MSSKISVLGYVMKIGDKIRAIRHLYKLSQKEFAEKLMISQGSLSDLETGRTLPSYETLQSILISYSDISTDWFLKDFGEMIRNGSIDSSDLVTVPYMGEIAAGEPMPWLETGEYYELPRRLIPGNPKAHFIAQVNGDSMEPQIHHGDLALCLSTYDWPNLVGKVCAFRLDGDITLKHLDRDEKHRAYWLRPINPKYSPIIIPDNEQHDFILIGKLVAVIHYPEPLHSKIIPKMP